MVLLRKCVRLLLVVLWFPLPALLALPNPLLGRRGIRRSARITRLWAAGLCRILNIRLTVEGDPSAFHGGMIVSNHQSYLDILLAGSRFPIRFAPKQEIRRWPVLGPYVALGRPIWIDRSSPPKSAAIADEIERTLRENISILVYPEGTSSDGRSDLLPFKSTPFEAACRSGEPFLPILLRYAPQPDGTELAWYGDMTLWPHVWRVLGLKRIDATLRLLPTVAPRPGESRKELAARTRRLMNDAYRSMP